MFGWYFQWEIVDVVLCFVDDVIVCMDWCIWQVLMMGFVELLCWCVYVGLWFWLLCILFDELNMLFLYCGSCLVSICYVWECCGYLLCVGQSLWCFYEILVLVVQWQMLEVVVIVIMLIELKVLILCGEQVVLFQMELYIGFINGLLVKVLKLEFINYW